MDGFWRIILPLFTGTNAILSGLCLPKITSDFPTYTLTDVVHDVRERFSAQDRLDLVSSMPEFSATVGGVTDILIGSRYKRYFPKEVYEFEDGLGIFQSVFTGVGGSRGVFNGTHKGFAPTSGSHFSSAAAYYTPSVNDYHRMRRLEYSIPQLCEKPPPSNDEMVGSFCCENTDPSEPHRASFCENNNLCMQAKGFPKMSSDFRISSRQALKSHIGALTVGIVSHVSKAPFLSL